MDRGYEGVHCWLMGLYGRMGRGDEVVRQYGECERVVREEMGEEPGEGTKEVYRRALEESRGKKVRVEREHEVVAAARRAGIIVNGFFMLGLPYDTEETMRKNIEHACSLPLHQVMFFVTIPFPGTEMYDIVKKEGRFLYHDERNLYEDGYFLGRASYEMPGFDAATLERMFKLATRRFYFRPKVILSLLPRRIFRPDQIFYLIRKFFRVMFRGRQF